MDTIKAKLKIKGYVCGSFATISKNINMPSFKDKVVRLRATQKRGDLKFKINTESQEKEWLDENYEKLVAIHYHNGDLDLIFDARIIKPESKVSKKAKIREILLGVFGDDKTSIAETLIVITQLWDSIKNNSPEKIVEIAMSAKNVAINHSINVLRRLNESFDVASVKKLES